MHDNRSLSPQLSLAKDKIRVLLLEGVNDSAVQLIETAGYPNMTRLSGALEKYAALVGPANLGAVTHSGGKK